MRISLLLATALLLTACENRTIIQSHDSDLVEIQHRTNNLKLISISIMDRNGLSETISTKERLKTYENANFLTAQPYQKVLRIFAKDNNGDAFSAITSYYPTGQIRQYLECSNGRAHGRYIEWHNNGEKKLQSSILGGTADLDEKSLATWSFHESSYCWNEEGKLIADIPYVQGSLEGVSRYYYPSGAIQEEIPYHKGEINGKAISYDQNGSLVESTEYVNGIKTGVSTSFWENTNPQFNELWKDDLLQEGQYFQKDSTPICQIVNGTGKRCIFGDNGPTEIQDYVNGQPEGEVVIYNDKGQIERRLFVKNGEKHGLETYYWASNPEQPKLTIEWYNGQIHGAVKTWYADGTPESAREMSRNMKQGHLTGWYSDGKIMLIEEYEKDRLIRGDYVKKGSTKPVSKVIDGKGVATFFDSDGTFRTRVTYLDGKPVVDDVLSEK